MKILVTGGGGQLGSALVKAVEFETFKSISLESIDVVDADLTDSEAMAEVVSGIAPAVIINAGAYTNVDGAESDAERAMQVNAHAVGEMAGICRDRGIRLLQISTDYVFDGSSSTPLKPDARTGPLSVYGRTKLEGERRCIEILGDAAVVVRTSWVYAAGHRNFVSTMLRLMREREQISVVSDQVGTPTWAPTLAEGLLRLVVDGSGGVFHLTDSGSCSWFEFARAIEELGREIGLLERPCKVHPIPTRDYPTPAVRPLYSILDKTITWETLGWSAPDWRESLSRCLAEWDEVSVAP